MKMVWKLSPHIVCTGVLVVTLLAACARKHTSDAPGTTSTPGPSPSQILKQYKPHAPPPLAVAADVPKFLDWAGASHVDEKEDARAAVAAVAGNGEVIQAFIKEIERVQDGDQPRALLAMALLGETRSEHAQSFFEEFAQRPLPQTGTVIEGEILEQTRMAQLQAKAVDGLAYANTERTNQVVMQIIAKHPSRIVRAEAINAYLWNHGDSDEARKVLAQYVHKDELIFLDRVRRETGESAESFNRKLSVFLQRHPEVVPPPPDKEQVARSAAQQGRAFDVSPPAF